MIDDESQSSAASPQSFVRGSIHSFILNAKDLKSSGKLAASFFASEVPIVKKRTQLIAALHILTAYLDGHTENLLLDSAGNPIAIDFAEILSEGFRVGARPLCWLHTKACNEPFQPDVANEIANLNWSELRGLVETEFADSPGKAATLNLTLSLLKIGARKGLSPNQLACFIIGVRPANVFEKEFRAPSAMHEIFNRCVVNGQVQIEKAESVLDHAMSFLVRKMNESPLLHSDQVYAYCEQMACSLSTYLKSPNFI